MPCAVAFCRCRAPFWPAVGARAQGGCFPQEGTRTGSTRNPPPQTARTRRASYAQPTCRHPALRLWASRWPKRPARCQSTAWGWNDVCVRVWAPKIPRCPRQPSFLQHPARHPNQVALPCTLAAVVAGSGPERLVHCALPKPTAVSRSPGTRPICLMSQTCCPLRYRAGGAAWRVALSCRHDLRSPQPLLRPNPRCSLRLMHPPLCACDSAQASARAPHAGLLWFLAHACNAPPFACSSTCAASQRPRPQPAAVFAAAPGRPGSAAPRRCCQRRLAPPCSLQALGGCRDRAAGMGCAPASRDAATQCITMPQPTALSYHTRFTFSTQPLSVWAARRRFPNGLLHLGSPLSPRGSPSPFLRGPICDTTPPRYRTTLGPPPALLRRRTWGGVRMRRLAWLPLEQQHCLCCSSPASLVPAPGKLPPSRDAGAAWLEPCRHGRPVFVPFVRRMTNHLLLHAAFLSAHTHQNL